ncbi:MAG: phytanoyl-CoA dioxygenase family protein [Pseudomonadota bacterium]
MTDPSQAEIESFQSDGFLVLERLIAPDAAQILAGRFEALFRGDFETGLFPDEWNWRDGRDDPALTRQICNGWRADRAVAKAVLSTEVGRLCAALGGWTGARLAQDNVIWKPPGAKPLGFHQDNSYIHWVVPPEYVTCWIALDDTTAAGGTIEYVRGSHRWGQFPPIRQFHAPEDYREALREAAQKVGQEPEIVAIEVPAGGAVLHHGDTWHGSGPNRGDRPRRSLVSHCISSEARFHPTEISYIYSRYKRVGDETMDESFFPILWTRDGGRSGFLEDYLGQGSAKELALF